VNKFIISILFLFLSQNFVKAQIRDSLFNDAFRQISEMLDDRRPADFKKQVEGRKVQLVDIRTPQEYNQGHMEGALNYNFYKPSFMQQMNSLDKSKPVYIYCRSGNRTGSASKKLKRAGFTKVYDLKGGINNWLRTGFTLIR